MLYVKQHAWPLVKVLARFRSTPQTFRTGCILRASTLAILLLHANWWFNTKLTLLHNLRRKHILRSRSSTGAASFFSKKNICPTANKIQTSPFRCQFLILRFTRLPAIASSFVKTTADEWTKEGNGSSTSLAAKRASDIPPPKSTWLLLLVLERNLFNFWSIVFIGQRTNCNDFQS